MSKMENIQELRNEFDKYKRSYNAIVKRNTDLENQYVAQENRIQLLMSSLDNCQKALDINKNLMRKLAEEHNNKESSLVDFMNKLKKKLRELGYNGSFDNLGN